MRYNYLIMANIEKKRYKVVTLLMHRICYFRVNFDGYNGNGLCGDVITI